LNASLDIPEPVRPATPTLALLELSSLARGYVVADALVKTAQVELLAVEPVTPGKILILYSGALAAVEMAHAVGRRLAADDLLDELLLPRAHPDVAAALGMSPTGTIEAMGLLECRTVAAGLLSADAAAKASGIRLLSIHAARGIGGKTITLFTGSLHDVEASLEAGTQILTGRGGVLTAVAIPSVHPDLVERLLNPLEVL